MREAKIRRRKKYSEITLGDRNRVKRHLQKRRLEDASSVVEDLYPGFAGTFLDFGCGDGALGALVARRFPESKVYCYEPAPSIFEEACQNLSRLKNVTLVSDRRQLRGTEFDLVFCLEVFEHLPARQTAKTVRIVDRLLADGGVFVVGVPNELFFPALVKGTFRMTRRYGAHDARLGNVLRAAFGRPPAERPTRRISRGLPYHFHHLGFDHRPLGDLLHETFDPVREFGSPVDSELFGTEVYFVLQKRTS